MRKVISHSILLTGLSTAFLTHVNSQLTFQTIVTQGPVVAGESFQVQYVIEGLDKEDEFFAPDFSEFRFISGPNIYSGTALEAGGSKKLKNIVFTLVAIKPGKFIIPGASARVKNKLIKSENVWLQVISKAEALNHGKLINTESNSGYFLAPGEDPYVKMQHNLFMKVLVDKRVCFVGEPVTATFKLYSRLESKSDIVKNPGLYGFTVHDMINLDDKLTAVETINGKNFDVHIVRKVQLYPLQPGRFNIDAMEVQNRVEFSKSAVSKKTEQEIVEGVFESAEIDEKVNTVVFENNMKTEPVAITVKPTPQKNKPEEYNGATGNFTINATLDKKELAKNEEGDLIITIGGKGNFTQLAAPLIQWPAGVEGFNPIVRDSLNDDHSPLSGKRVFYYRFVSAKPGTYRLPAVSFSFFKPDSNKYKTIATQPMNIDISKSEKLKPGIIDVSKKPVSNNGTWKIALATAVLLIVLSSVFYWLKNTRNPAKPQPVAGTVRKSIPVAKILQPATTFSEADDITFYTVLRNCIWNFFTEHFGLTGSNVNKSNVVEIMKEKGVAIKDQERILEILKQCEVGVFTNSDYTANKKTLLKETKDLLEHFVQE